MQTLMLTVEYDGTGMQAGRPLPKKKILIRSWGESILLLPGCSKRTYSYSVPQKQTLVFMQEGRFSAFRPLLPCCLLL